MVRINLLNPQQLSDQHLVAEYLEIIMLTAYVRKYPRLNNIPEKYTLGQGHIKFFKNKLRYLQQRHELLKLEMRQRGFKARVKLNLQQIPSHLFNNWQPQKEDYKIIRQRINEKLEKKPYFYRYYGEHRPLHFFQQLLA